MSDKNLILIIMIAFLMLSIYDLMTLYNNYMCIEAVEEFGVFVVSLILAYVVKTNKIKILFLQKGGKTRR